MATEPAPEVETTDDRPRWAQWFKFAGFLGVGVALLLVTFAMAAPDRPELEPSDRADDVLIFISSSPESEIIEGSSCLTTAETDDLFRVTPNYFVVTIRDGRTRAESVAACVRDQVDADVRIDPL